jgi:IS30 family transposase
MDETIKILCAKNNVSVSEIGRRLNKTPQAFSQKVKRGKFTLDDLQDIAMVAGCKCECSFVFPDGEKISVK